MPDNESKILLESAFLETLEQMAFLFGESADAESFNVAMDMPLQAEMYFNGHCHGRTGLIMSSEFCAALAENLLGLEPGENRSEDQARDALKELLNVVTSQLLTRLVGDTVQIQLSIPTVSPVQVPEVSEAARREDVHRFYIEGHPVLLSCKIEGNTP